jgi:hypothetical protein
MAVARRKPDPDGIVTARLAGASGRHTNRKQLDVNAAIAELREIANGRSDLLAKRAGLILAFRERDERDGIWPQRALQAALLIAAGADLNLLTDWIQEGLQRAERVR